MSLLKQKEQAKRITNLKAQVERLENQLDDLHAETSIEFRKMWWSWFTCLSDKEIAENYGAGSRWQYYKKMYPDFKRRHHYSEELLQYPHIQESVKYINSLHHGGRPSKRSKEGLKEFQAKVRQTANEKRANWNKSPIEETE